jgi:dipeptidyl-peptidase-4
MRMTLIAALALIALPCPALRAQQKTTYANRMEAIVAGGVLSGRGGPRSVNWIDGGKRFSFIARSATGSEIRAMDPATGKDTLLFSAAGMSFPDTAAPFRYQSFQWARDSRHLVFQANFRPIYRRSGISDFYVYSLDDTTLQPAAKNARSAELSPDGTMLGFERDGDMYTFDLAQKRESRLTRDAHDLVYNGHFDWVYEEEFGMAQAWSWSADSRHLAYWQVDESEEPVVQLTDYSGSHPEWDRIRIPNVGDPNPKVRIGVVDVHAGSQVWLDTGEPGDTYIPRIYWTGAPDTLAVMTLNRAQNTMKLFFFDVRTGGRRQVFTQTSDTWLDVYDFYAGIQDMISFPAGRREFFWISDRDGWQHVYRYDYSGRLINQVTKGAWSVTRIEGIDPAAQTIYYSSTEASPLERQLYAVKFDGRGKRRLTQPAGNHNINMSPDTRFYIDRWSNLQTPNQVELWATGGAMLKKMEDNAAATSWLATHAYSPAEIFSFTTSDGVRIDGSIVKPFNFDSTRRYPVIFSVYGGPGSQQVYNEFGSSGFDQWLAQEGYIVVGLNNRGSNNYGSAFMKVVYKHLGRWESNDFAEAARYLAKQPYVDSNNIGIMGTSYGAFSAMYTIEMYPDIFKLAIANSTPADWRYYDTIYTERYMGLLGDNAAGYDSSSVISNVKKIKGRVLLVHSMLDDNVHPQNTMQLLTALTDAGIDADLRIYPPGHHGAVYNGESFQLLQGVMDDFLAENLKGHAAVMP